MAQDNTSLTCPACGSNRIAVFRQPASKFSSCGAVPALRCAECGHRAVGSAFPGTPEQARKLRGAPALPAPQPTPSRNRAEPELRRAEPVEAPAPAPAPPAPVARAVAAPVAAPAPVAEAKAPRADVTYCAWKECDHAARPGSKYCSRECSNKNARYRYSKRSTNDLNAA